MDIGGISALRSFRLFRIFKLAREWVSMRIILHKIMLTAIEVSNFSVLLGLFMYIYALIGMQVRNCEERSDELAIRQLWS